MRIVVAGALMMDLVLRMARPPELGEALEAGQARLAPGGKGLNQAVAAARLGAEVTMIGRVGDDDFGRRFLALLDEEGIDRRHLGVAPGEGTGIAVPMVYPDGDNSIVFALRANERLSVDAVRAAADAIVAADMLVLQLEVPEACNLEAAAIAARAGVPVLLNTAPAGEVPAELRKCVDYVVANEVEAAMLTGNQRGPGEAWAEALLLDHTAAFVTLGELGAVVATPECTRATPAPKVPVVDTVGAGDAFCGALAVALCEGRGPEEGMAFGVAAGSLAATRAGAAPSLPGRKEVDWLLTSLDPADGHTGRRGSPE